jgi:hypothetical protein
MRRRVRFDVHLLDPKAINSANGIRRAGVHSAYSRARRGRCRRIHWPEQLPDPKALDKEAGIDREGIHSAYGPQRAEKRRLLFRQDTST